LICRRRRHDKDKEEKSFKNSQLPAGHGGAAVRGMDGHRVFAADGRGQAAPYGAADAVNTLGAGAGKNRAGRVRHLEDGGGRQRHSIYRYAALLYTANQSAELVGRLLRRFCSEKDGAQHSRVKMPENVLRVRPTEQRSHRRGPLHSRRRGEQHPAGLVLAEHGNRQGCLRFCRAGTD